MNKYFFLKKKLCWHLASWKTTFTTIKPTSVVNLNSSLQFIFPTIPTNFCCFFVFWNLPLLKMWTLCLSISLSTITIGIWSVIIAINYGKWLAHFLKASSFRNKRFIRRIYLPDIGVGRIAIIKLSTLNIIVLSPIEFLTGNETVKLYSWLMQLFKHYARQYNKTKQSHLYWFNSTIWFFW